jgi:hypothetical protein
MCGLAEDAVPKPAVEGGLMKHIVLILALLLTTSCSKVDPIISKGDMAPWVFSKEAHGLPELLETREAIDTLKQNIPHPDDYRSTTEKAL